MRDARTSPACSTENGPSAELEFVKNYLAARSAREFTWNYFPLDIKSAGDAARFLPVSALPGQMVDATFTSYQARKLDGNGNLLAEKPLELLDARGGPLAATTVCG